MRKTVFPLVAASFLLAACSSTSTTSTTSPTSRPLETTTSTSAATTTTAPGMIKVDAPLPGASVSSPFTLSGSANVYEAALNAEAGAHR